LLQFRPELPFDFGIHGCTSSFQFLLLFLQLKSALEYFLFAPVNLLLHFPTHLLTDTRSQNIGNLKLVATLRALHLYIAHIAHHEGGITIQANFTGLNRTTTAL